MIVIENLRNRFSRIFRGIISLNLFLLLLMVIGILMIINDNKDLKI